MAPMKGRKTEARPVSKGALVQRINRRLAHDDKRLSWGRDPWGSDDCFRVVDTYRNEIIDSFGDLEAYAKEVGVLAADEHLMATA